MSGPDPEMPAAPDSAMDTGSDAGAPGDHLADLPLDADEIEMLARLQQPGEDVVEPVEDSAAAESAAEDDAPLPVQAPADHDDPLDATFRSATEPE